MIGCIDEPSSHTIINSNTIVCKGWAYSESGIISIKIIIDDHEVGEADYGLPRTDVKKVYPQYAGIERSGFSFSQKIPLVRGSHKLKVMAIGRGGDTKKLGEVAFRYLKKGFVSDSLSPFFTRLFNQRKSERDTARRRISSKYLKGQGIEIGALHNPLVLSSAATVRYVDRLPLPELQKHYFDLNPDQMVKIDIIDNGETLSRIADSSLDFIIANHFLEHCENPIGTIRNHINKIRTGGVLYYAIPEMHATFDKDRSLTGFDHLVEDDIRGPEVSKKDHFAEWVTRIEKIEDQGEIARRVSSLMAMNYSIHYHVWDVGTIFQFWDRTNEYLGNSFTVSHFEHNVDEVITILKKRDRL
jgi:hypothetical protein